MYSSLGSSNNLSCKAYILRLQLVIDVTNLGAILRLLPGYRYLYTIYVYKINYFFTYYQWTYSSVKKIELKE